MSIDGELQFQAEHCLSVKSCKPSAAETIYICTTARESNTVLRPFVISNILGKNRFLGLSKLKGSTGTRICEEMVQSILLWHVSPAQKRDTVLLDHLS